MSCRSLDPARSAVIASARGSVMSDPCQETETVRFEPYLEGKRQGGSQSEEGSLLQCTWIEYTTHSNTFNSEIA